MRAIVTAIQYFTGFRVEHRAEIAPGLSMADIGHRLPGNDMARIISGTEIEASGPGAIQEAVADILDYCEKLEATAPAKVKPKSLAQEKASEQNNSTIDVLFTQHNRGMH